MKTDLSMKKQTTFKGLAQWMKEGLVEFHWILGIIHGEDNSTVNIN